MTAFGFLLIQGNGTSSPDVIIDKTLYAVIERQEVQVELQTILVQLELVSGGVVKNKKSKFQKHVLDAYRGDSEAYRFKVTLDDMPFNLTGYTIRAQARQTHDDPDTLFDIQVLDGVLGSDFVNGIIVLPVAKTITAILPSVCVFDIQASQGSVTMTLVSGELHLDPDITRP